MIIYVYANGLGAIVLKERKLTDEELEERQRPILGGHQDYRYLGSTTLSLGDLPQAKS